MTGTGTTGALNDTNAANNTGTFSVLGTAADMSASFAGFPASAAPGTTVSGTVSFVNTSTTGTATTAVFTLALKPGLGVGNVTVTSALLGNGVYNNATGVVTFPTSPTVVNVTPSGTVSASISFLQTSTGVTGTGTSNAVNDTNPANNTGTFNVPAVNADVGTTLTMPASATPGGTVTATVTFFNLGPSTANDVTRTVVLSGGTLTAVTGGTIVAGSVTATFAVATLASGSSASFTFTYVVPASGTVRGTSTITTTTADINLANNVKTATTVVSGTGVDLSVTLTLSPALLVPPTSTTVGGITSTVAGTNRVIVTVTNVGSLASGGSLTVNLPSGFGSSTATTVTFTVGQLSPGESRVFTTTYSLPGSVTTTQTFTATVAASGGADINPANDKSVLAAGVGANLKGLAWIDSIRDGSNFRTYQVGETLLPNVLVKLTNSSSVVVGTAFTNSQGQYQITGIQPGSGYSLQFFNCSVTTDTSTCNAIGTTPVNQGAVTSNGNQNNASTVVETGVSGGTYGLSISGVSLYAGDNTVNQNLPIDPSGVVYRTDTREPLNGAILTLYGPYGTNGQMVAVPGKNLVSGINTCATGGAVGDIPACPSGQPGGYEYLLKNAADGSSPFIAGNYVIQVTPPAGFSASSITPGIFPQSPVPAGADIFVQSQSGPPKVGQATTYYLSFNLSATSANIYFNHIPLDPGAKPALGALLISKTGNKTSAELGDSVQYTIRVRNTTLVPITGVKVADSLPAGFRYILGTSRLGTTTLTDPAGGVGRDLSFAIGTINGQETAELTYFVRLGVGSQQGDGINSAKATGNGVGPNGAFVAESNIARFKVNVLGGVFTNDGCIAGKVYVDCDGNGIQNNTGGSREVGIPGVRLVMLDGSFFITDSEGKYSVCGVKPQTHVVKVDRTTLPKGSRMVPSSNRNAGVGDSLFVDLKGGELARADFIEGSCSPEVLDQVKARRAQGGVTAPETEKGLPLQTRNRPGEVQREVPPSNPGVVQ
ncbi:MAG: DUF11 domain-containing protein [Polaromonas sp.]|nr:DUF11 domain-containing protein [Polaromonas sp.]